MTTLDLFLRLCTAPGLIALGCGLAMLAVALAATAVTCADLLIEKMEASNVG